MLHITRSPFPFTSAQRGSWLHEDNVSVTVICLTRWFSTTHPAAPAWRPPSTLRELQCSHQQSCPPLLSLLLPLQWAPQENLGYTNASLCNVELSYAPRPWPNPILAKGLPNQHCPCTPKFPLSRLLASVRRLLLAAPGGWSADHMTAQIPRIKAGIVHFSLKSRNPG